MNNKGQFEFGFIIFIVIVLGLIFLAPIMLKIVNSVLTPFSSAIGNQSNAAGANVTHIKNTFITWWDWAIIIAFVINVMLLVISAFLVDTHPVWLLLWILFGFFTFVFAPTVLGVIDNIYSMPQFNDGVTMVTTQLPLIGYIKDYFGIIMVSIFIVSGLIMYGKYKLTG